MHWFGWLLPHSHAYSYLGNLLMQVFVFVFVYRTTLIIQTTLITIIMKCVRRFLNYMASALSKCFTLFVQRNKLKYYGQRPKLTATFQQKTTPWNVLNSFASCASPHIKQNTIRKRKKANKKCKTANKELPLIISVVFLPSLGMSTVGQKKQKCCQRRRRFCAVKMDKHTAEVKTTAVMYIYLYNENVNSFFFLCRQSRKRSQFR